MSPVWIAGVGFVDLTDTSGGRFAYTVVVEDQDEMRDEEDRRFENGRGNG